MQSAGQTRVPSAEAVARRVIEGYRPLPGVYDELMDDQGSLRPHWLALLIRLGALGDEGLRSAFAAADRHLKASGVFYRVYDDPTASDRPWPLSHLPLLVTSRDWALISAGVIERIELIEKLVADAYGPQTLVRDGHLPAALLAGNAEFLRPLSGIAPVGGRHLGLYAVDLGRGPDGAWWVIRDRTQAPSGAGYAVENRIALSRAIPSIYRHFRVERLANFFDAFRARLRSFRKTDDAGVCVLTPGPLNEVYFEHAYLARYLGFPLVEGQDLTVRDRRVYLRTIAGLKPVNVLWRRVDSDWVDPLELDARSAIGVPGLVDAVRAGKVALANAIGSGVAEAPALLGFLPVLAQHLNGRPLLLPNVATWWCGQPRERAFVLDHLDDLVVAPALGRAPAGQLVRGAKAVAEIEPKSRAEIVAEIERRGVDFVGQEVVQLSTTPVWTGERLEPRPFILRVFVAATENGWTVMPGGLGLIGEKDDTRAVSMQHGARSADVWVLSDSAVSRKTLLPPADDTRLRRATGAPPARAADNLFWLARYLERTDTTVRVVRALASRVVERPDGRGGEIEALSELLWKWGAVSGRDVAAADLPAQALYSTLPGSVPQIVGAARASAAMIRDRFPPDAWRTLDDLAASIAAAATRMDPGQVLDTANATLRSLAALAGLELENMSRIVGWRFMRLGRHIERAISICRVVRQLSDVAADPDRLDALLEIADSQITYRTRYMMGAARAPVVDLVLFDDDNPRSLAFQVARIAENLAALPGLQPDNHPSPALASSAALAEALAREVPRTLTNETIIGFENRLMQISNDISQSWFTYREPVRRQR
ncbi:MAG: circularly permuted type 2 ATP-grasp protein [Hyphomicrobiaceae bacterium]